MATGQQLEQQLSHYTGPEPRGVSADTSGPRTDGVTRVDGRCLPHLCQPRSSRKRGCWRWASPLVL